MECWDGQDFWKVMIFGCIDERRTTFPNEKQVSLAPFSPHPSTPDICAFSYLESLGGREFLFDPFTSGLYRFIFSSIFSFFYLLEPFLGLFAGSLAAYILLQMRRF